MSLLICKCGHEVPQSAGACEWCGRRPANAASSALDNPALWIGLLLFALGIAALSLLAAHR